MMTFRGWFYVKIQNRYLKNNTDLEELEMIRGSVLHKQKRSSNELILHRLLCNTQLTLSFKFSSDFKKIMP